MTTFSNKKSILSLVMAVLLTFTMFPTSAMAADTDIAEDHVHTDECEHYEVIVETDAVVLDEAASILPEDNSITAITVETEKVTISETVPATSGTIGESNVEWNLDTATGHLIFTGSGDCEPFTSADDQPWASVRTEIKEVWFYDMDSLAISDLAYWFDGCASLEMAEIPYTTPVIGTRAFADCPSLKVIMIYHDGCFEIKEDAFAVDTPSLLEIRYIPTSESTLKILAAYNWEADNRYVTYEDVYGIVTISTGTCSMCWENCGYSVEYECADETEHWVRHWCSNCGHDQIGGFLAEGHSFDNGACTLCGFDNGTGSGGNGGNSGETEDTTCYHLDTYYSWSGCTYYEYCSNCGEYMDSGISHSSTYTEWSGCSWYEYCIDCGELMASDTNHESYSYSAWEYYNYSQHRRLYACTNCGEGTYFYGYHSTTTVYSSYSSSQHAVNNYCSACSSYVGSTSYKNHKFTYGSWTNYNINQHRRSVSCSDCGYMNYEYANHSLIYGTWTLADSTLHKRSNCCSCGYSTDEAAYHKDSDYNGYCDDCEYLLTFFSVTVPANMSLTVSKNGEVYAATNAAVINNSSHAVEITAVTISAGDNWTLVPYDYNMADEKVDSRLIGFYLNGAKTSRISTTESLTLPDNWTIARDDFFHLQYDAVVSATSDILQNEQVLTLVFIINWAPR